MSERTWFRSKPIYKNEKLGVDREAGIIYKVAVNTEGEAKGHGVNLDKDFVREVVLQGNNWKNGLKARFGHPQMSSEALGTSLGKLKNFRDEEKNGVLVSYGDLHLSEASKNSPNGNLHEYVLDLAEETPEDFGMSIVFTPGKRFKIDKNGTKIYEDDDEYWEIKADKYVELKKLHACDCVDEPAANPEGLFSSVTFAGQVSYFLDRNPELLETLKKKPEIIYEFLEKYGIKFNKTGEDSAGINNKQEQKMDLTSFKAEHPELYKQVFEAGKCEGLEAGVTQERSRAGSHIGMAEASGNTKAAFEDIRAGVEYDSNIKAKHDAFEMKQRSLQNRIDDNVDVEEEKKLSENEKQKAFDLRVKKRLLESRGLEVTNETA